MEPHVALEKGKRRASANASKGWLVRVLGTEKGRRVLTCGSAFSFDFLFSFIIFIILQFLCTDMAILCSLENHNAGTTRLTTTEDQYECATKTYSSYKRHLTRPLLSLGNLSSCHKSSIIADYLIQVLSFHPWTTPRCNSLAQPWLTKRKRKTSKLMIKGPSFVISALRNLPSTKKNKTPVIIQDEYITLIQAQASTLRREEESVYKVSLPPYLCLWGRAANRGLFDVKSKEYFQVPNNPIRRPFAMFQNPANILSCLERERQNPIADKSPSRETRRKFKSSPVVVVASCILDQEVNHSIQVGLLLGTDAIAADLAALDALQIKLVNQFIHRQFPIKI